MSKISNLTAIDLVKIIKKIGFEFVRQRGSHMFFKHPDGRITTIPNHPGQKIGQGLLNTIIKKDLQLSREAFIELCK